MNRGRTKRERRRAAGQVSVHAGQGHGERLYVPVKQTNLGASVEGREMISARHLVRDEWERRRWPELRKLLRKPRRRRRPDPAPVSLGQLRLRVRWRPRYADGTVMTSGGAGGFHLPQREGRSSYIAPALKPKRRRSAK